jgi:integrase
MEDLATRPLDPRRVKTLQKQGRKRTCGYAKSTINQYLAAISSFYRYAECHGTVRLPDGREVELTRLSGIRLNPVDLIEQRGAAGAPQRERVYLSLEQLRHFLSAIPRHTTLGLRDRALLLFYVMTGGRNSEVRTLRWGDLRERGGHIFWRQRGRGKEPEAWKALPPECWEALQHYLKAARRWDDLQEGDYLFTALTERAAHLPTVSEGRWEPHAHPLSINEVTRIVKRYAKRAGLDPKEVHVRSLRHSAAMLMDEVGADPEEIRDFLNHENLDTTRRYLHEMRGQRNVHAAKMAEALRL